MTVSRLCRSRLWRDTVIPYSRRRSKMGFLQTSSAPALVSVTLKKSWSRALVGLWAAADDAVLLLVPVAEEPPPCTLWVWLEGRLWLVGPAWSLLAGVLASTESVDRRLTGLTTRLSGDRDRSRYTRRDTPTYIHCVPKKHPRHFWL